MKYLLLLLALLQSSVAVAFPAMVRYGYTSCAACHVSPTGGGALKQYGRTAGEDLATIVTEGDGNAFGGLFKQPDWLAIGGDQRYINVRSQNYNANFLMQADVELAAQLTPGFWVDASAGLYGPDKKRELRRNYVLWTPSENISVRGGRFFPAYGIMTPDHTVATRQVLGWQEGAETYNLEVSVHNEWGELFVTDTFQGDEDIQATQTQGYKVRGDKPGAAVRAAAYLERGQVGASYWFHSNAQQDELDAGPFVMWGLTRNVYLLTEWDRKTITSTFAATKPGPEDVEYTELGWEVYRGVHLQVTHEYDHGNLPGVGLQLFPLAHMELVARAKYNAVQGLAGYLMIHSWL